jgi:NADH:ubiquinone oxidoreductase subunit 6 (subunit J)
MALLFIAQGGPRGFEGRNVVSFVAEFWPVLLPVALGLAGTYLLLPRARRFPPLWGALCGAAALVIAGWLLVRHAAPLPETILFYGFSAVAIVGGVLLVTHHNPVYGALAFALVVLSTCGLFLLLAAPFLMAATVIIYAGAIIVTFLFVIMLAQQAGLSSADLRSREPFLSALAGFVLLAAILCVLQRTYDSSSLDPYLDRVQQAAGAKSEEELQDALGGNPKDFFKRFSAEVERDPGSGGKAVPERQSPRRAELANAILAAEELVNSKPVNLTATTAQLARINAVGRRLQITHGTLAPPAGLPLSPFSGHPPNKAVALTPEGRQPERLPAENVASLGRSLFTDYLLAVELAGTLLLVATIGAIAIGGRRAEGMR